MQNALFFSPESNFEHERSNFDYVNTERESEKYEGLTDLEEFKLILDDFMKRKEL